MKQQKIWLLLVRRELTIEAYACSSKDEAFYLIKKKISSFEEKHLVSLEEYRNAYSKVNQRDTFIDCGNYSFSIYHVRMDDVTSFGIISK